jgi:hypothetical protein
VTLGLAAAALDKHGQLWQLKIRTNREIPKYLAISGGHPCRFGGRHAGAQ